MSDLIDRQALKKAIGKVYACDWDDIEKNFHFAEAVNSLPSVEPERTAKVYKKQAPDKLYYFYCGACGEMIDCSFYEDYKSIKSYCGYCGAKLDWGE